MEVEDIVLGVRDYCQQFLDKFSDWTIIIRWATATWKSKLSLLLSDFFDVEIISADSRQIFRGMDIWTDKVPLVRREKIPHNQIDIVNPDEIYTAGQWKFDVENEVEEILWHKKHPIIVWWTGLYIDTIYKNFQMPECAPNYEYRDELQKKNIVMNYKKKRILSLDMCINYCKKLTQRKRVNYIQMQRDI